MRISILSEKKLILKKELILTSNKKIITTKSLKKKVVFERLSHLDESQSTNLTGLFSFYKFKDKIYDEKQWS